MTLLPRETLQPCDAIQHGDVNLSIYLQHGVQEMTKFDRARLTALPTPMPALYDIGQGG